MEAVKLLKETALRGDTTRQEDATKLKLTKLLKENAKLLKLLKETLEVERNPTRAINTPKYDALEETDLQNP